MLGGEDELLDDGFVELAEVVSCEDRLLTATRAGNLGVGSSAPAEAEGSCS